MGPPVVQGAPVVSKMGARAQMSDWSQQRDTWDGLDPDFLNQPPHSNKSLDLQTGSETTFPLCNPLNPSTRRSLRRMRSSSEVTISDAGVEDVDPAAINPNTGVSLRREYGSTSTLDRQTPSWRLEQKEPSAPPPLLTVLSPSLQTATRIAHGDVVYEPDYMDASVYASHFQKTKPEMSILSRLNQRANKDIRSTVITHKSFSHYDIQSILFNISKCSVPRPDLQTTVASAGSRCMDPTNPEVGCDEFSDDGKISFLVRSCPFFHNEIGGETEKRLGLVQVNSVTWNTSACASFRDPLPSSYHTNGSISVLEFDRDTQGFPQNQTKNHDIEHFDLGAKYYLKYFYNRDHQNYFGTDKNFGPVSLSIRREKLGERKDKTQYNYRMILRTSQLSTLRGSIMEDSIPSSSKHGTSRDLPLRDILEFVVPELEIQSLRLAATSPRVPKLLLQLDQRELSFQHRVGVLLCRAGQSTEEDMYNNETSSFALDQFLDLLGHKVPLKDATGDAIGGHSVFATFREFELMFHVSTLLPYTVSDPQQLLRKSLIGNDIVTIIFQEPDAPPFSPQSIRLHFQHVFIIIRVHQPCSQHTCYSVAVSRHNDVPSFGPLIPAGWMFPASPAFRDFLLMKIINAEHAIRRSETFITLSAQQRQEHLRELVENFSTSTPIDSSLSIKFSLISLGGKKKARRAPWPQAYLRSAGALTWSVMAKDPTSSITIPCQLAISNGLVVLIDEKSRQVMFHVYCRDVIGWSAGHKGIKLFYERGDCVMFFAQEGGWEDIREITLRLQLVTCGGPAVDMTLRRNHHGQLGFHINFEGVVADVETQGFAWQEGLRPGCRLVEICAVAIITLSHEQMIDLLRTSATVNVVAIPPHRDGTPRRSFSEMYRVPAFEYKLDSDITSCPYKVTPPPQSITGEQLLSSTSNMKEEPRSPSKRLSSCDPGTPLTPQSYYRAPPDWSIGSDESSCERIGRSKGVKYPHHRHHMTKALRKFQPSPTDATRNMPQPSAGNSCSTCSSTLSSSSSSEDRHSDRCLINITAASIDSGIDSTACTSSALPAAARATLVLRDVQEDGRMTSAVHMTDLSETVSRDSRGSTNWSDDRLKKHSSADSPEAFISTQSYTLGAELAREEEELKRSEGRSRRLSCVPVRHISLKPSDVAADEKPIRVFGVPVQPPWRYLTRTMSHDALNRTLIGSSQAIPPTINRRPQPLQSSKRFYSDSLLAQRSKMAEYEQMSLPQDPSHLDMYDLVDRAFKETDECSVMSLTDVDQMHHTMGVTSRSSTLQDSDITATSLSGKVLQLEEILHQLQLDLLKEQQDKVALQQQVLSLRQENLRLQQERQSGTEHVRRFTGWMLPQDSLPKARRIPSDQSQRARSRDRNQMENLNLPSENYNN